MKKNGFWKGFGSGLILTVLVVVLGVTATAPDLKTALAKAYAAADNISFEGLHRRSDIGHRALEALR